MSDPLRVALYTYSTRPRGGVVHTLNLAEALRTAGCDVTVFALGKDSAVGFFRPVSCRVEVVPFRSQEDETFEARILRYIDTLVKGIRERAWERFDIHHAQDCITANALWQLREEGWLSHYVRTVHHMDDFTSRVLIECQERSIREPDVLVTVSRYWRDELIARFGRASVVIYNGVEERFFLDEPRRAVLRERYGLNGKTVFLTVGGVEPRKNTLTLLRAFAEVKKNNEDSLLWIAGGETLFDYRPYREQFEAEWRTLPAPIRDGIQLLGPVTDEELLELYRASDCFVQPSTKEGWGLAVMEAMASGVPVIASTIPVFREYLTDGVNALLVDPENAAALAERMGRLCTDEELRHRLVSQGRESVRRYTWRAAAQRHLELYREILSGRSGEELERTWASGLSSV